MAVTPAPTGSPVMPSRHTVRPSTGGRRSTGARPQRNASPPAPLPAPTGGELARQPSHLHTYAGRQPRGSAGPRSSIPPPPPAPPRRPSTRSANAPGTKHLRSATPPAHAAGKIPPAKKLAGTAFGRARATSPAAPHRRSISPSFPNPAQDRGGAMFTRTATYTHLTQSHTHTHVQPTVFSKAAIGVGGAKVTKARRAMGKVRKSMGNAAANSNAAGNTAAKPRPHVPRLPLQVLPDPVISEFESELEEEEEEMEYRAYDVDQGGRAYNADGSTDMTDYLSVSQKTGSGSVASLADEASPSVRAGTCWGVLADPLRTATSKLEASRKILKLFNLTSWVPDVAGMCEALREFFIVFCDEDIPRATRLSLMRASEDLALHLHSQQHDFALHDYVAILVQCHSDPDPQINAHVEATMLSLALHYTISMKECVLDELNERTAGAPETPFLFSVLEVVVERLTRIAPDVLDEVVMRCRQRMVDAMRHPWMTLRKNATFCCVALSLSGCNMATIYTWLTPSQLRLVQVYKQRLKAKAAEDEELEGGAAAGLTYIRGHPEEADAFVVECEREAKRMSLGGMEARGHSPCMLEC